MNRLLRRFTSKKAVSTSVIAVIIVVIVIAVAAAVYISVLKPSQVKAQPITLAPTRLLAIQGTPITFTVSGLLSQPA
jgi:flagellar basal body-associated protein FliL